jgi:hypothetical protein
MADYLCRWPNGEFSIVSSRTKHDAIELLDEWGNAEQASLNRMSDCMFDFRLSDDGQIQLAAVGEATEEYIMETCYPELQKALNAAEGTDSEDSRKQIRQAVERERTRLWDNQRPAKPAATELGREIQSSSAPQAWSWKGSCGGSQVRGSIKGTVKGNIFSIELKPCGCWPDIQPRWPVV